ncbi:MAG: hypothetical protein RL720_499 [Actinomycetota bacterium]
MSALHGASSILDDMPNVPESEYEEPTTVMYEQRRLIHG